MIRKYTKAASFLTNIQPNISICLKLSHRLDQLSQWSIDVRQSQKTQIRNLSNRKCLDTVTLNFVIVAD